MVELLKLLNGLFCDLETFECPGYDMSIPTNFIFDASLHSLTACSTKRQRRSAAIPNNNVHHTKETVLSLFIPLDLHKVCS